jgi:sugar phosphate isomerase/epimerase
LSRPIKEQLEEFKPVARDLAAMNREIGITAVYQNHAGAQNVGASLWDLDQILEGISPKEIGVAFDVRHATVEALQSWPVRWDIMQPHLAAACLKDTRWEGLKLKECPLGEGIVDKKLFQLVGQMNPEFPISLHVEYLQHDSVQANVDAMRKDFQALKELIRE